MQKFIGQYRIIPALRLKHRFGGCDTYRHLELCGIAIDDLIQALYPAAELFLLLWYRAFALFYTLYGTLTHFTERLQGTAKNVQFFTQTIRQHGRYRLNSAVQ